ncbi:hypothetical protein LCGC14_0750580 [marine sediment metagenome]|jgi:ArsR family transcriptional regulator, arsenate/arsenite/antimonite-responsive transcriptional repressor|uniref:HTH arsR-type domain-containing protein n=1 Tax=marine sediment metagenome TaxID=412755 RepID=A0A0F9QNW8_9ZZZZ|nr:metalloregulator ArsR/SmtB family transcription factor [Methylophaga sp.]HEC60478.1 metalloregulator ArsR/SmtB family transcription factor [Methylophaga sp.]
MLLPIQLFKILSDDTRLTITMLLREAGELCVCDICLATSQSQPKISRHIAILRESGLVLDRREGKWIYYRLSPFLSPWTADIIDTTWQNLREGIHTRLQKRDSSKC